jgi:hypothetical protein
MHQAEILHEAVKATRGLDKKTANMMAGTKVSWR